MPTFKIDVKAPTIDSTHDTVRKLSLDGLLSGLESPHSSDDFERVFSDELKEEEVRDSEQFMLETLRDDGLMEFDAPTDEEVEEIDSSLEDEEDLAFAQPLALVRRAGGRWKTWDVPYCLG